MNLSRKYRNLLAMTTVLISTARGEDLVPYTIESIRTVGGGYVELVDPGRVEVRQEAQRWPDVKIYVRSENIESLMDVEGVEDSCSIVYSTDDYSERISVLSQSCADVLGVLTDARRDRKRGATLEMQSSIGWEGVVDIYGFGRSEVSDGNLNTCHDIIEALGAHEGWTSAKIRRSAR